MPQEVVDAVANTRVTRKGRRVVRQKLGNHGHQQQQYGGWSVATRIGRPGAFPGLGRPSNFSAARWALDRFRARQRIEHARETGPFHPNDLESNDRSVHENDGYASNNSSSGSTGRSRRQQRQNSNDDLHIVSEDEVTVFGDSRRSRPQASSSGSFTSYASSTGRTSHSRQQQQPQQQQPSSRSSHSNTHMSRSCVGRDSSTADNNNNNDDDDDEATSKEEQWNKWLAVGLLLSIIVLFVLTDAMLAALRKDNGSKRDATQPPFTDAPRTARGSPTSAPSAVPWMDVNEVRGAWKDGRLGHSVAMSADGSVLAYGTPHQSPKIVLESLNQRTVAPSVRGLFSSPCKIVKLSSDGSLLVAASSHSVVAYRYHKKTSLWHCVGVLDNALLRSLNINSNGGFSDSSSNGNDNNGGTNTSSEDMRIMGLDLDSYSVDDHDGDTDSDSWKEYGSDVRFIVTVVWKANRDSKSIITVFRNLPKKQWVQVGSTVVVEDDSRKIEARVAFDGGLLVVGKVGKNFPTAEARNVFTPREQDDLIIYNLNVDGDQYIKMPSPGLEVTERLLAMDLITMPSRTGATLAYLDGRNFRVVDAHLTTGGFHLRPTSTFLNPEFFDYLAYSVCISRDGTVVMATFLDPHTPQVLGVWARIARLVIEAFEVWVPLPPSVSTAHGKASLQSALSGNGGTACFGIPSADRDFTGTSIPLMTSAGAVKCRESPWRDDTSEDSGSNHGDV